MDENVTATRWDLIKRFESIYASTYYSLYRFVRQYIKEEDTIKDILQDSYIRLWEKLGSLQDDDRMLPLLRTMVSNTTIDHMRKISREYKRAKIFHERQELIQSAHETLDAKEAMAAYPPSLDALPEKQRLVYQLVQEEGLSYKEVAERLSLSFHTIKYHITKARQALQQTFPQEKLMMITLLVELYRHL